MKLLNNLYFFSFPQKEYHIDSFKNAGFKGKFEIFNQHGILRDEICVWVNQNEEALKKSEIPP